MALLLDKKSAIHTQTSDAIYTSHKSFQQFERKYFLDNLKNLRVIAAAKAKHIEATESAFHLEQLAHPPNQLTARGYPRWPGHPAQSMLKEDVESGLANTLKPAQLRAKRSEYKGFPSDVFRGHIHQEKRAQREADFWIPKRNKDAQRKRDKEAKELNENSHIGTVYVGSTPKTLDENKRPFVSGGSTTEEESLPQEVGGGDDDELSLLTEAPSIDSRSSRVSRPRKVKDKKGSSKRRGVSSSHTVESRGSRRSARLTRNRIVVETVDEANQS